MATSFEVCCSVGDISVRLFTSELLVWTPTGTGLAYDLRSNREQQLHTAQLSFETLKSANRWREYGRNSLYDRGDQIAIPAFQHRGRQIILA